MALRSRLARTLTQSLFHYTIRPIASSAPLPRTRATRVLLYSSLTATATASLPFSRSFAEVATLSTAAAPTGPYTGKTPEITLYQYEVCPFCNKVRAYLDYHNIPYSVVEVDPLRKKELSFSDSYKKVPIALIDGVQVNGSGEVISHMHETLGLQTASSEEDKRWLQWLDDKLIHLIAPNIYRTPTESLQTFEYIAEHGNFTTFQRSTIRYTGAAAMYFIGKKLKKKYDVNDAREEIHSAVREWTTAITKNGGKFLGGDKPGMADLSIYGVLRAIETFDTFREIRERNSELGDWFDRTRLAVGDTCVVGRE